MDNNKLLQWLGLARRAGCLACGDKAVESSLLSSSAFVVIIAEDAGGSVTRKMKQLCEDNDVHYMVARSKNDIGCAVGLAATAVVAIEDEGIAKQLVMAK